jgi:hypothetical protein
MQNAKEDEQDTDKRKKGDRFIYNSRDSIFNSL